LAGLEVDRAATPPDLQYTLRDLGDAVRRSLGSEDRELFEAWLASAGIQGWQREFARGHGRSDAWVSCRIGRIRTRLAEVHGIPEVELFLHELAALGRPDAEEPRLPSEPVESLPEARGGDHERQEVPRDRLREAFADGSREHRYMNDMADGVATADITRAYPDEEDILWRVHERYWRLARDLRSSRQPECTPPRPADHEGGANP
jgi:hypothetical protein